LPPMNGWRWGRAASSLPPGRSALLPPARHTWEVPPGSDSPAVRRRASE
jgi:hypothetical protein